MRDATRDRRDKEREREREREKGGGGREKERERWMEVYSYCHVITLIPVFSYEGYRGGRTSMTERDRQTDRETDRQTDRQTRQTDTEQTDR